VGIITATYYSPHFSFNESKTISKQSNIWSYIWLFYLSQLLHHGAYVCTTILVRNCKWIALATHKLTKIRRKFEEGDRKCSPIFSKWEYFCQNGRIIRKFWQGYSHFENVGEHFSVFFSTFSHDFLSVQILVKWWKQVFKCPHIYVKMQNQIQ